MMWRTIYHINTYIKLFEQLLVTAVVKHNIASSICIINHHAIFDK